MVTRSGHIPERGDIVWVDFSPQRGHEQANRRPAVVISPRLYNAKAGLALVCPITSQAKGYPFEVPLQTTGTEGVVLVDQMRSVDWRARRATFIEHTNPDVLHMIQERVVQLVIE